MYKHMENITLMGDDNSAIKIAGSDITICLHCKIDNYLSQYGEKQYNCEYKLCFGLFHKPTENDCTNVNWSPKSRITFEKIS